jgi:hypothetical protein
LVNARKIESLGHPPLDLGDRIKFRSEIVTKYAMLSGHREQVIKAINKIEKIVQ